MGKGFWAIEHPISESLQTKGQEIMEITDQQKLNDQKWSHSEPHRSSLFSVSLGKHSGMVELTT